MIQMVTCFHFSIGNLSCLAGLVQPYTLRMCVHLSVLFSVSLQIKPCGYIAVFPVLSINTLSHDLIIVVFLDTTVNDQPCVSTCLL